MLAAKDVSRLFQRRPPARERIPLAAAAAGLGAGLMYLADPDRGARRRALVRDKSMHAARRFGALVDKASRDLSFRARGLAAGARSLARQDHPSDEVVRERVRACLGRVASHPHAIQVHVHDGCVDLHGRVPNDEIRPLVARVRGVSGVLNIENELEPYEPEHLEDGQARDARSKNSKDSKKSKRGRWSPVTRLAMGALGSGLIAYGIKERGQLGVAAAAAGTALLLRDVANQPLRRLLGMGAGRRAVDFHKTILVHAPVEDVYDFFTRVENFPRFMSHLQRVDKIDEDRYRWVAEGPLRVPVSWEAEVTERVPNCSFAWRSVPGAAIGNAGIARFEPAGDLATRVDIQMCYNPPLGAVGHAFAALFGADPKHAMDEDLVRFQSLLERGKTSAHHHRVLAEDVGLKR